MGKKQGTKQQAQAPAQPEPKPAPQKQQAPPAAKQAAPAKEAPAPAQDTKKGGKKGGKNHQASGSSNCIMNADDATKTWLKQELVALLGFPEVDDILSYILTEFKSQGEVAPYLIELLGVPTARAQTIASRLFATAPATSTKPNKQQKKNQKQQQQQQAVSAQAAPLVPVPSAPNSRVKQAKIKKPSKVLHARIINCLQCGRIERNAARRCVFCDSELRYEELDDDVMDQAAQDHMKRLVELDECGASRTTVLDTEEEFYDQVAGASDGGARHLQPIVLNLDLENRLFETVESAAAPSRVLSTNRELPKDARDLLQNIQKKFKGQRANNSSTNVHLMDGSAGASGVVLEDEYNALYV